MAPWRLSQKAGNAAQIAIFSGLMLVAKPIDHLWQTSSQKPLLRSSMIDLVSHYCKKAGIVGVKGSSHSFRHTMAKLFLLHGGQAEALQYLLGHSSLEMTRYYVDLFPADLHQQHQKYSPIENLFTGKGVELDGTDKKAEK